RVGVDASSQGVWTAALMAARTIDIAFRIVRAGSGTNIADTILHEIEWSAREKGLPEPEISEGMTAARVAMTMMVRGASTDEYDAAMKRYRSPDSWPDNFALSVETPRGQNWIGVNAGSVSVN